MKRVRPTASYLPVLGLLAAVLVLLAVLTAATYFNLSRGDRQARSVLAAQSSAIISGMTAGLRTGWRHWVWQRESLQDLIGEMTTGEVAFVTLLDDSGLILAHSRTELVGKVFPQINAIMDKVARDGERGWFSSNGIYLAGRKLSDDELGPPRPFPGMGPAPGMGMGPRMGLGPYRGMGQGARRDRMPDLLDELPKPAVIIVGIKTDSYQEARHQHVLHGLLMAGMLFVLGSAAIYFIFVIQNYRTVDRTLSDLTTYTAGIVDRMPNGLISLDGRGRPVMVNRAAREMFGWGASPVDQLRDDPTAAALYKEYFQRLARGEVILEQEFNAPHHKEGAAPMAVSAALVPAAEAEDSQPGPVFILRDLRQIRDLEGRVRQSEKLASLGRLAAGVAHEVRNPLSSMRGLARFLARDMDEASREAQYLKVMVEEIDRLDRVITGLLDYARPREPNTAEVDLNEVARYTSDLVSDDVHHKHLSLREDMSPKNPRIMADRDMVIQAMLNVILNAVDATPEGGRLTVSTVMQDGEPVFAVEDTGPGIRPEDRNKILDPFFTTKEKGAGLGLAQVASIMDAHRGRIVLGGEPGMGARVELIFPAAPPSASEE